MNIKKGEIILDKEEKEIWKIFPDYPFIEASNLGRVRTRDRYALLKNGGKRFIKGRVLKQSPNNKGYMCVSFCTRGKQIHLLVHRICATCFVPNPLDLPEVNHIDNDPTNNIVSNLEWCTRKYNISYKERYGKSAAEVSGRPVFAVNLKTGKVLRFETQLEAAQQLGVNATCVNNVVKGKQYTAGGYWFTEDENKITEKKIKEIKANMQSCPVIAVNQDTFEVFYFDSQREAARQLRVNKGNLNSVLKGRYRKTGRYWFCYADENAVENTREKFGDELAKKVEELMNDK